jgi:hypothetical protein
MRWIRRFLFSSALPPSFLGQYTERLDIMSGVPFALSG